MHLPTPQLQHGRPSEVLPGPRHWLHALPSALRRQSNPWCALHTCGRLLLLAFEVERAKHCCCCTVIVTERQQNSDAHCIAIPKIIEIANSLLFQVNNVRLKVVDRLCAIWLITI